MSKDKKVFIIMSCYVFLIPTLMLWASIPNNVLKYLLVEVKELKVQEANKGMNFSTIKMFRIHTKSFQTINIVIKYIF